MRLIEKIACFQAYDDTLPLLASKKLKGLEVGQAQYFLIREYEKTFKRAI